MGFPLLIGLSRKSFLGFVLDLPVEKRLIGTVAANTIAILNGADIVRVHDYLEAVQMVRVIRAIQKVEPLSTTG
jgi:dihydropteroate synthase